VLRTFIILASFFFVFPVYGQTTGVESAGGIRFSAQDSLVITGADTNRVGRLFGQAKINAEDVELGAHTISIEFAENEVTAEGLASDTGMVGRPSFQKGDERFQGRKLSYNLDSGKGRVVGARTVIDEGFIYGGVTKQASDSVLFVKDAMYTTCDREEDPHYHIRASKMKIVNGEWIYSGPMHLRILNVPLPLWLPFGFLPARQGRRSGPLPPSFGEDSRGFFMRDFGWYFAMNDYTDFQIRLGIWTGGSFEIAPLFRYAKRYHYSGQVGFNWVRNVQGLKDDPDFVRVDTWSLRATHDQTLGKSASLTSNIDLSTSNYLRTASRDYLDNVRQTRGPNVPSTHLVCSADHPTL
jgi:lipopolysaccharide assembly outer membrane protein LptD (OstA)